MNCIPISITMLASVLAVCLLVPAVMPMAARRVVARASMPEDKRYYAALWQEWHIYALRNVAFIYVMAPLFSILIIRFDIVQSQLILDLPAFVWFALCYRSMANLRASLVPDTEFKLYASKFAALKFRTNTLWIILLLLLMALCGVIAGLIDDATTAFLAALGMLVAIGGSLSIIVDRYATRSRDRILPASEMEMLRSKLAEANRQLNQNLPDGHIPVKLELMEFMMGLLDSLQSVRVEMVSEKRVSVSLLGLKRLDENELLFLSLSETFRGVSIKSEFQADQRALAITADREAAISALKKELATAFIKVRQLEKRIKALEVI